MKREINKNRVVTIQKTNGDNVSWKYFLSKACTNNATNKELFNYEKLDRLDVATEVELLMEEPLPKFATDNDYKTPIKDFVSKLKNNKVSKIMNILNAATGALDGVDGPSETWEPWTKNVISWNGTAHGGITFDYTFKFALGQYGLWNAKEEVVKPIFNLMAPTIPREVSSTGVTGPFPNDLNMLTNVISDVVSDIFSGSKNFKIENIAWEESEGNFLNKIASGVSNGVNAIGQVLSSLVASSYKDYTFDVQFGNVATFYNMIMVNSHAQFANEVDQFGYPISGSVTITFNGLVPLALSSNSAGVFDKGGESLGLFSRFGGEGLQL